MESAYDPGAIEQDLYQQWESSGLFQPQGDGDPYCIMIPPPNVTGSLHMGHGFNNTIMDALIRYQRMRGRRTLWQPGTDHAGIATQMVVERQLAAEGVSRHDLGRDAFLDKVWAWKARSGGTITRQIRRLGSSVDWSRERFTMDEGLSQAVREAFIRLYRDGLIYRGKRLVNWDPILQTAISDLEVESLESQGFLWHLRYPVEQSNDHAHTFLVVATTRPETMLGDTAVAVHPDDERYRHLIGQSVRLPLTGRLIPIIADTYVDPAFGSGCVKITPAHDFNDYDVGQRHQLPMINVFDSHAAILHRFEVLSSEGCLQGAENAPEQLAGLDRIQARKRILELAELEGWLERTEAHTLKVPRGDRSQAIIEPWLTDQWYVRTAPLAERAVAAVEQDRIRFVPSSYRNMFYAWMRDIQDWCISRQLWWGHRIPAWYDADGNVYVGNSESEVRQQHHIDPHITLSQDPDVLDTWFSSGLWTFSTLGWPEQTPELQMFHPTQVLVTGFDIIFFWVARMIMLSMHLLRDHEGNPQIPFEVVYVHGLVRDSEGQKMSKSKGNVLDPLDVVDGITLEELVAKRTQNLMRPQDAERIAKATRREFPDGIRAYGTDALRFTFAALASTGRDIKFDMKRVEGYRNFCNKIWNASRFVMQYLPDFAPGLEMASPGLADRWIETQLHTTCLRAEQYFAEYRFDLLAQCLYEFVWNDLCDWYLELCKPMLNGPSGPERQRCIHTLLNTLDASLRLLHPIIPFMTEALWQRLAEAVPSRPKTSIMQSPYPVAADYVRDEDAQGQISWLQHFMTVLRSMRNELNLAPGCSIELRLRQGDDLHDMQRVTDCISWIQSLGRVVEIRWIEGDQLDATATALVHTLELHIPLAGLIDLDVEAERLSKHLVRLDQEIVRIESKLASESFRSRAPVDVVAKEEAKLQDYRAQRPPLAAQLQRLQAR